MEFKSVNHYGLNVVKNHDVDCSHYCQEALSDSLSSCVLIWSKAKFRAALSGKAKVINRSFAQCYS